MDPVRRRAPAVPGRELRAPGDEDRAARRAGATSSPPPRPPGADRRRSITFSPGRGPRSSCAAARSGACSALPRSTSASQTKRTGVLDRQAVRRLAAGHRRAATSTARPRPGSRRTALGGALGRPGTGARARRAASPASSRSSRGASAASKAARHRPLGQPRGTVRDLDRARRRRAAPPARRPAAGSRSALCDDARRIAPLEPIALVVDDEQRAARLAGEHVERAVSASTSRSSRKAKRSSRRTSVAAGEPRAQLAGGEAARSSAAELLGLRRPGGARPARPPPRSSRRLRRDRPAEVEPLEQGVDERCPARSPVRRRWAPGARRRRAPASGGQPEHPLGVEAVAAARVLAERRVAEARDRGRRRGAPAAARARRAPATGAGTAAPPGSARAAAPAAPIQILGPSTNVDSGHRPRSTPQRIRRPGRRRPAPGPGAIHAHRRPPPAALGQASSLAAPLRISRSRARVIAT